MLVRVRTDDSWRQCPMSYRGADQRCWAAGLNEAQKRQCHAVLDINTHLQHPNSMETASTSPMGIADSFLPNFDRDQDKKRLFLSYRLCGVGRDEAMDLAGISRRTLYHWRQKDPDFDSIERKTLPELKKTFTQEIIYWEYIRNLKMVLELDSRLLDKALDRPGELTRREWGRLRAIRARYE